jgi:hypothetical protein
MNLTSEQFLKSIGKDLPSGTSVRVRLPYTEATFEFDSINIELFVYMKAHADCLDHAYDYVNGVEVIGAKLTFRCVGEEVYHENI